MTHIRDGLLSRYENGKHVLSPSQEVVLNFEYNS